MQHRHARVRLQYAHQECIRSFVDIVSFKIIAFMAAKLQENSVIADADVGQDMRLSTATA
jgi:hypothetical protein